MAADTPVAASLSDECGFVRVAYPAGVTGSFTVRRDGSEVVALNPLPGGGNFAVFAGPDQTVSLAGSLSGSHQHATPDSCAEPKVAVVSFDDRCQDSSAVTLRNNGSAAAGFRFVVGTTVTEIPSVPPGESTHVIGGLTEYGLFSVGWANPAGAMGTVATHVYATPGDCGAHKLAFTFADGCDKLEWTVTNGAAGAQKVELLRDTEIVSARWIPAGGPQTYSVPAAAGASFQARYVGGTAIGDPHTYHVPANCAAGGLPITGMGTQPLVLFGVLFVIGGFGVYLLARRRLVG